MKKRDWFHLLETVGLSALSASPLAPIAPIVAGAIKEAESIPGASSQEKLAHVVNIATNAAQVAQAEGVKIDPAAVQSAAVTAISTAVTVTNIVHAAQQQMPKPVTP